MAVAAVLSIIALAAFATYALRLQQHTLRANAVAPTLARIDAALAGFVMRHRRLPCPARGNLASGAAGAGLESINLASGACVPATQADGVVPWVSLGLTANEILSPMAQGRISYRVQPSLASNTLLLMNMSWCDPAGVANGASGAALACTAPCAGAACTHPLNYLYGKGLQVKDAAGTWLNQPAPPWPASPTPPPPAASGAAYVLVSHGPNGLGAYNSFGVLQGTGGAGNNELANSNGVALTAATVFISTAHQATPGPAQFDDELSHPTLAAVLAAAALGPRTPH